MPDRIACVVPFCRRTIAADAAAFEPPDNVWICARHYAAVPKKMKAVRRRARKALRAAPDDPRAIARYLRLSRRLTRYAIERGVENV